MKRFIALFLALVVMLSLVACGAKNETPAPAATEAPAAEAAPAPAETEAPSAEPVTIKTIHYMVEGEKAAALEAIQAEFTKKYPNVSFENSAYSQGTDYFAQLSTAIASGDMPEIMMGNPGLYTDLIDGGFVMDLTGNDVIEGLGLTQADMGDVSYNGKWYAFPVDFKTWGVYYNKAIFAELGLEVPTTHSELLAVCQALVDGGYDAWAEWYADGASVDIEMRPIVWTKAIQNGDNDMFAKLMADEAKIADYPYFAEALQQWGERIGSWARVDATSNNQSAANEVFLSGQAGMLYQGTWNYGSIESMKSDDFEYGFFLVPTDDDAATGEIMNVQVDQAFMVNPQAENADWAVKFMEFFLSECMGMWSDGAHQPCITGATTENTSDFMKSILDVKASGAAVGYGEFTAPFTSAYTSAYRKALTAYANYCCTGTAVDGVDSVESCIEYMQELFDEEFAQANL